MRLRKILLLCAGFVCLVFGALNAPSEAAIDFDHLDGVALGDTEDAVITAFRQYADQAVVLHTAPPMPSDFVLPSCPPTFDAARCARLQDQIANDVANARRRLQVHHADLVTPVPQSRQDTARFVGARAYCARPDGTQPSIDHPGTVFDSALAAVDRKVKVVAQLTEMDPQKPCQALTTAVYTSQKIEGPDQALHAAEDAFIKAANEKFGTPTYFLPRHIGPYVNTHFVDRVFGALGTVIGTGAQAPVAPTIENRLLPPFSAWCDVGTLEDCKNAGPSVNRRLTLTVYDLVTPATVEIKLEDLRAVRRAKAAATKNTLKVNEPQL